MRALVCLLVAILVKKQMQVRGDEFRPTPIPVDEWNRDKQSSEVGTLHETIATESPPSVAAVPAHYWEDALRHSVYLTLVRDKIDQLIAKGDVISPNDKPDKSVSKDVDDHDLWDKIKKAPFDRLQIEELNSSGDVTIMAKGRLLEDDKGFRFTQDERTKEKCGDEKCATGVKAFWSVKRVRQRDQEISPGKYHYELTFSVISQWPKKQKKPYENPIRTFTVKETTPDKIEDYPHERRREPSRVYTARPQRAIWVHRNIAPAQHYSRRHHRTGLQRIFSSLFSDYDDDDSDEQPRHRNHPPHTQGTQFLKAGPAGGPPDYHYQSKPGSYQYKPQNVKYGRPQLPPIPPAGPLQHQFLDYDSSPIINGQPHSTQDNRFASSQSTKTTRPASLPTPLPSASAQKESTFSLGNFVNIDSVEKGSDNFTRVQDSNNFHRNINKPRPTPVKVNYFPEHIRPPVYNAPPGVFATMDKKPFKPLPPLKIPYNTKPQRPQRPSDFRPSPQVHDSQSTITDPLFDNSFKPITISYVDSGTIEKNDTYNIVKKTQNKIRKTYAKKPAKKNNIEKHYRVTTATPDIITMPNSYEEETDNIDWVNVLGAFTKTTPMVIQTEKPNYPEFTTIPATTEITPTTEEWKIITTTETEELIEATTSTTPKPKKRTRPPPKFTKHDKLRKHKRITTTQRPTTTTKSTTNIPEKPIVRRPVADLTTESSYNELKRSFGDVKNKTQATTSTTTHPTTTTRPTTSTTITTRTTTAHTSTSSSTTTTLPVSMGTTNTPSTTRSNYLQYPRNRNRFRQSTLFYKGTSVKHDKWSHFRNLTSSPQPSTISHRRLASNFQGYSSTKPTFSQEEINNKEIAPELKTTKSESFVTPKSSDAISESSNSISVMPLEPINEQNLNNSEEDQNESGEESKEQSEFINYESTTDSDKSNEVAPSENVTATSEVIPIQDVTKNKTKICKKKLNATSTESVEYSTTTSTTTEPSSMDIFQELFGLNLGETSSTTAEPELKAEPSSMHESFLKVAGLKDFMDELNEKNKYSSLEDQSSEQEYEDEDDDDENDDDNDRNNDDDGTNTADDNDDKEDSSRNSRQESYNLRHPYSFLELMAME
ncbi:mucin-5AC-like [Leptidea sinapis]|uniref:mucin-5AC-like n=1 Tax=Leptidea sinapis TaxID=189913 RepID=UPI0021C41173|nr:mucin-5AC-like [Leptidea sinapis]